MRGVVMEPILFCNDQVAAVDSSTRIIDSDIVTGIVTNNPLAWKKRVC